MVRIKDFGAGLVHLGVTSKSDSLSFVGIFAKTSPEWVIAEYGSYAYNLVVVPFYDSIGPEACQAAINRRAYRAVFVLQFWFHWLIDWLID